MGATCRNDKNNFFTKYLPCKVRPANFLQSWKRFLLILQYWILDNLHQNKKDTVAIKTIHYITRNYFFTFAKNFLHFLASWNVFENGWKWFSKYLKCIHARCEHPITYSQCQAQKYKQKKGKTTGTDYEHINTIRTYRS